MHTHKSTIKIVNGCNYHQTRCVYLHQKEDYQKPNLLKEWHHIVLNTMKRKSKSTILFPNWVSQSGV